MLIEVLTINLKNKDVHLSYECKYYLISIHLHELNATENNVISFQK